jgi:hypothetical protein
MCVCVYVYMCVHIQERVISQTGNVTESVSIPVFWDSSYSFSLKTLGKAIYLLAAVGSPGEMHTTI